MNVTVNGNRAVLPEGATVKDLLAHLGVCTPLVAVERNKTIVPRARHAECSLVEGDEVEVVTLVGGG